MELVHKFTVPSSIDVTWAAFNDLERVAPCFPGATIASIEGDEFAGSVKVKLGPIAMLYNGTGSFTERDEANHRAVIVAKGKDKRGNGTAGATIVAVLSPDGTGTAVEVTTDLAITGKPAQFGRGVMQDVSDKLLGIFVECIAGKLGPEVPAATEPGASTPPPAAVAEAISTAVGGAHVREVPAEPPPTQPAAISADAPDINMMSIVLPALLKRIAMPIVGIGVVAAIICWVRTRR